MRRRWDRVRDYDGWVLIIVWKVCSLKLFIKFESLRDNVSISRVELFIKWYLVRKRIN